MKTLPIGIEDFKEVKTNCYYVDKTLILEDLFARGESATFLYARPRRFGKSLTLSMINYFFSDAYDSRALFADTLFAKSNPDRLAELNTKNVVRLNLKSLSASSFDAFCEQLSSKMSRLYDEHIKSKGALSEAERRYVETILQGTASLPKLEESLERLCELCFKIAGKKTLILIDEYDAPYQSGYDHGYLDKAASFLKNFLGNALKGNEYLYKAVLTGVTPVAKTSVFSDLNSMVVNTVFDDRENECFGFDEEETEQLLKYFGFEGDINAIKKWYGGYSFQKKRVFNPWSVLSFVDNGFAFRPYWVKTGSNSLIKECLDLYVSDETNSLFGRLLGEGVYAELDTAIDFLSLDGQKTLLSLLVMSGYLTAEKGPVGETCLVMAPNDETRYAFREEILDYSSKKDRYGLLLQLKRALLNGDADLVGPLFSRTVLEAFSYLDLTSEKSYQLIFNTFLALLFDEFAVSSEYNSGSGRADIFMRSKSDRRLAFIFELKYLKGRKEEERLLASSKKALRQIKANGYYAEAKRMEYKKIYLYGLTFSGKRVNVLSEAVA